MTAPDDPAAALAGIRSELRTFGATYYDTARLLAAVEAALKLADKLEPQAPASSALEEDRMWIRQECAGMIREAEEEAKAQARRREDAAKREQDRLGIVPDQIDERAKQDDG